MGAALDEWRPSMHTYNEANAKRWAVCLICIYARPSLIKRGSHEYWLPGTIFACIWCYATPGQMCRLDDWDLINRSVCIHTYTYTKKLFLPVEVPDLSVVLTCSVEVQLSSSTVKVPPGVVAWRSRVEHLQGSRAVLRSIINLATDDGYLLT